MASHLALIGSGGGLGGGGGDGIGEAPGGGGGGEGGGVGVGGEGAADGGGDVHAAQPMQPLNPQVPNPSSASNQEQPPPNGLHAHQSLHEAGGDGEGVVDGGGGDGDAAGGGGDGFGDAAIDGGGGDGEAGGGVGDSAGGGGVGSGGNGIGSVQSYVKKSRHFSIASLQPHMIVCRSSPFVSE